MTQHSLGLTGATAGAGPTSAMHKQEATGAATFAKTKMCKLFILGECTRGERCRFAHSREQLKGLPKLARNRVCKSLINTGHCDDPECPYAHSREEFVLAQGPGAICNRQVRQNRHHVQKTAEAQQTPQQAKPPQILKGPQQQQEQQQHQVMQIQHKHLVVPSSPSPCLMATPSFVAPQLPRTSIGQCAAGTPQPLNPSMLLQMGQAAQAFAHEAARLQQAMTLLMQMRTIALHVPAVAAPNVACIPWLDVGATPMAQCATGGISPRFPPAMISAAPPCAGGACPSISTTMLSGRSVPERLPEVAAEFAPLAELASRSSPRASAMPRDPMHIDTMFLKSVNSKSVCSAVASAGADDLPSSKEAQQPFGIPVTYSEALDSHAEAERRWREFGEGHAIGFDQSGLHVKNTFLDIDDPAIPRRPLRAVHTADGRLDLMGQQASSIALGILDEDDE